MYVLTCAERMIWGVSVLTSCHLCLHVVLSVPQYHLFSSTTSQRRGTDNTAAIAVFPASYGCKDLLPSVACYFSLFLTHIRHCCIFATANGKRETIHPLRFARRPCLRGTVSYNRHLWKSCRISVICVQFTCSPLLATRSTLNLKL